MTIDFDKFSQRPQRSHVTASAVIKAARQAPLTSLVVLVCVIIFLGLASEPDTTSWIVFTHWGWLPPSAIYDGSYWGLVSSAFVHANGLHLFANLSCLWLLGSCLERAVGTWRWVAECVKQFETTQV